MPANARTSTPSTGPDFPDPSERAYTSTCACLRWRYLNCRSTDESSRGDHGHRAVSPNGIGREAFWEATRNGRSGVRRITRFDASRYAVQVAGEVTGFREEDYVSPKDRPHVSRAAPLAVAAVQEALADSGIEPARMSRDQLREIGVILGSGGGSQEFTEEQYRLYYAGKERQCSVYVVPTGTIGTLAGEVSMRFGFRGLSHVLSTGCTSSTDAIGYAYRNIRSGVIDVMVSGGVDAPIAPLILRGFMLMRIMSTRWNAEPERASRPFSRDRDGFVVAEGSGSSCSRNSSVARARGAKIYGEIAGYGSTCEAFHRVRLEECGEEPARAMRLAIAEGGIPPSAVQYIHYHGTSTEPQRPHRDQSHPPGLRRARLQARRLVAQELIGHPQGACGAAGIAATLLAMPRWRAASHHQPGCPRSAVRPGLRHRRRPPHGSGIRPLQLHRLRQQELRYPAAQDRLTSRLLRPVLQHRQADVVALRGAPRKLVQSGENRRVKLLATGARLSVQHRAQPLSAHRIPAPRLRASVRPSLYITILSPASSRPSSTV